MKHIFIASILSLAWVGQAGNGNVIIGNGNKLAGNGNMVKGDNDLVNGNMNVQIGDASSILGNNNFHVGSNQQITGDNQYLNNMQGQVNYLTYGQANPSINWGSQVGIPTNNFGSYLTPANLPINQAQQNYLQPNQQQILINPNTDLLLAKRL